MHAVKSVMFFNLFYFVVPMGIFPMGNSGRFPLRKPAATELRNPTLVSKLLA